MKILQTIFLVILVSLVNCGSVEKERLTPVLETDWFSGKPELVFYDNKLGIFCADREDFLVPGMEFKCLPLQTKKVLIEGSCRVEQDFVIEIPYNLVRTGFEQKIRYVSKDYQFYLVEDILDLKDSPIFEIKNDNCSEIKREVITRKFVLLGQNKEVDINIFADMPYKF